MVLEVGDWGDEGFVGWVEGIVYEEGEDVEVEECVLCRY